MTEKWTSEGTDWAAVREPLADFLADEHHYDDMNSRCECGWYYASPESYSEHLADAFIDFMTREVSS